jgi:hypothetical protein
MLNGFLVTTAWRVLRLIEEKVCRVDAYILDSRQGVILRLVCWMGGLLILTKRYRAPQAWSDSLERRNWM